MGERRILFLAVVLSALLVPSIASANMGIPMIVVVYPAMGILLIPVIALEVVVLRRRLSQPLRRTTIMVTVANLASTGVGVPVTWAMLLMLQMATGGTVGRMSSTAMDKLLAVTWQAPWLMPWGADEHWMIPVATLVLLVPFFFASWFIEYYVSLMFMRQLEPEQLKSAVFQANLLSYALLAAIALVGVGVGIYQRFGI